jgi:DNA recombination protein RmuC
MIDQLTFLSAGILVGVLSTWVIFRLRLKFSKGENESLLKRIGAEVDNLKLIVVDKEKEIVRLSGLVAGKDADLRNLDEKLKTHKDEVDELQEKMKKEFRLLAGEILNENSDKLNKENRNRLDDVLKPFNENLKEFKKKVEDTYEKEADQRRSLRDEVKRLAEMNLVIGEEARALTRALKGDSKTQGIWGEKILERILENSGLKRGEDFIIQDSHLSEDGRRLIPDVSVKYPGKGNIIIDSKVSLLAYEKYVNADDDDERERALKAHILSVKNHIKSLASKNYESIYKESTLDFVMMFMPIEPAYYLALQNDNGLWNEAYEKGILLISPTNLIAALRMIENVWRQVKQEANVVKIAEEGAKLYDGFADLLSRLSDLGTKLDSTQKQYDQTMIKLTGRGNLISKVDKLKNLGVKTRKSIPDKFTEEEEDDQA